MDKRNQVDTNAPLLPPPTNKVVIFILNNMKLKFKALSRIKEIIMIETTLSKEDMSSLESYKHLNTK